MVDDIIAVIQKYKINFTNEKELQQGIAGILDREDVSYGREVVLGAHDRIDFLVEGLGIEVKIGGSLSSLLRQLYQYAKHENIECLLVISSRKSLTRLPEEIRGKPIRVIDVGNPF